MGTQYEEVSNVSGDVMETNATGGPTRRVGTDEGQQEDGTIEEIIHP